MQSCRGNQRNLGYVESIQKPSVAGAFAVLKVVMKTKVRQGCWEQTLKSPSRSGVLLLISHKKLECVGDVMEMLAQSDHVYEMSLSLGQAL